MRTLKLYDNDGYTRVFSARVLSCSPADGRFDVVLDQTAFFPEEGGQCCDKGYLHGIPVLDVQERDGVIHHILDCPLDQGALVEGEIDWPFRFRNMQTHTGEHILSALILREYRMHNKGFHLGATATVVDYDGVLERPELDRLEDEINRIIYENHPVRCWYPATEELKNLSYRCKTELADPIRIVQIGENGSVDSCACCAPHVRLTGEIGMLKILDYEHYKQGTRLFLVCGTDALLDYRARYMQDLRLSAQYSVKQNDLSLAFSRLEKKIEQLQKTVRTLRENELGRVLQTVSKTDGNICLFFDGATAGDLRVAMNHSLPLCGGICIVLTKKDLDSTSESYDFMMASSSKDLTPLISRLRAELGAKCGGNPKMAQGFIPVSREAIENWVDSI